MLDLQESLANAKVSARLHCVYKGPWRRNVRQINTRNTMSKSTFSMVQRSTRRSWCQSKTHMPLPSH